MRPASLYCAIFVWNAITGGRFIAAYFYNAYNLSNSEIGTIIAFQFFISSLVSGWGGHVADSMERQHPLKGRIITLAVGLTLGTSTFLIENMSFTAKLPSLSFIVYDSTKESGAGDHDGKEQYETASLFLFLWHLFWRNMYAVSNALVAPVLDGLTLAHLKREATMNGTSCQIEENKYGRERLHGAIWWGIGNAGIGYCIDRLGFDVLCSLSVVSIFSCYITIALYYFFQADSNSIHPENLPLLHNREGSELSQSEENENRDIDDTDDSTVESHCPHGTKSNNDEETKDSSEEAAASIWTLLHLLVATPYSVGFFVAYFVLNIGFTVVENLIFLFYMPVLDSSSTMCGLSVIFTVFLEVPVFYYAPMLLNFLGPGMMMMAACVAFILRTIGYVLVPKMGLAVFALDLLHGITYASAQSASVAYINDIVPDTYEASGQGLLLLIKGMGGTIGLVVGGLVQENYGARMLYVGLGILTSCGLLGLVSVSAKTN